jgi:hypothetical protein
VTLPLIFGITGVARSGKDTLGRALARKLGYMRFPCLKMAFASEVKHDLDEFTKANFGFSAFTEKDAEKKLIRPLVVAYAEAQRKLDNNCWLKKLEKRVLSALNNQIIVIITDVRKENEAKWIKEHGGFIIHVKRAGIKPADFNEKANDPIIQKLSDFKISWKDFDEGGDTCKWHLNKLFTKMDWTTYGKFKESDNKIC